MTRVPAAVFLLCASLATSAAMAAPTHDEDMQALASKAGCLTCHAIRPDAAAPAGAVPIGPAWQDVAKRYHGQKGAADKLTNTVLQGSSPYQSHWKNKVSGLAMPPNAVAINEADTRRLVRWILTLDR